MMDPIDIPLAIILNISSTILANQAKRLEETFLGKALKVAGLIEPNFHERLKSLLTDAISHFFREHPLYRRQSIVDFFQDELVARQISEHLLNRNEIDNTVLLERLQYYVQAEPETLLLLQSRQLSEQTIVQYFFTSYRYIRNQYLDPGQIAIIDVIDNAERQLLDDLKASEIRLQQFILNLLTSDTSSPLAQHFEVDEDTYIRLTSLHGIIDQAIQRTVSGYIAIIGSPGSGKSTTITQYIKKYENRRNQPVIKYYCFTSLMDSGSHRRLTRTEFLDSIIQQLQLVSRTFSPDIATNAQAIKSIGYFNSDEKRFNLILERLKEFLQKLSLHLEKNDQKLLLVIDGIDHVARAAIEEDTKLLSMLLYPLPRRIICLVGTQSIQYLPIEIQRNCQTNGIIEMPRFNNLQIQQYIRNYKELWKLFDSHLLREIVSVTQGVPLYLRYVMTYLQGAISRSEVSTRLSNMPKFDENIETYYLHLWSSLNSDRTEVRICELLARSPFPIKKGSLVQLLDLEVEQLIAALSRVEFLLVHDEDGYHIFHESFRAFVDAELDDLVKRELDEKLFRYLNVEEFEKDLWYRHSFRFALKIGEYNYLVENANTEFIEKSVNNGRSKYELINNLRLAIDASRRLGSPQPLARIGALVAHTAVRFDYHLNSYDLFTCLLAINSVNQAIELLAPEGILEEINDQVADSIVYLAVKGYMEEASKLANQYFDRLPQKIDTIDTLKSIANLLAIFGNFPAVTLASWIDSQKDHTGLGDKYNSTGCELLQMVLKQIYSFKRFDLMRSLKTLLLSGENRDFWASKWYLYVAFLEAKREPKTAIYHVEVASKYITDKIDQLLLAGLSVELGAKRQFVEEILNDNIELPPTDNQAVSYFDAETHFKVFRSYIKALISTNKLDEIQATKQHLKAHNTWMSIYHLACIDLVSNSFKADLSTAEIFAPLGQLYTHKKQEHERIFEVFDVVKQDLPQFIQILVDTYFTQQSDTGDILTLVSRLDEMELLNIHFGIGLAITDYTAEILCLEAFAHHANSHEHLKPLLLNLHNRIKNNTLETEARSKSLMYLAKLSASFGYRQLAREILNEAQRATRGYGNRKDLTIRTLLEATKIVNKYDPENALNRFADIGNWIRWLPKITDGSETKWFNHVLFEAVLDFDFGLAVQVLQIYFNNITRWKFYDCLAQMLQRYEGTSFRLAYVLAELVSEWDEKGFKEKFNTRIYLLDQVMKRGTGDEQKWLVNELRQFVLTEVDPRERKDCVETFNKRANEYKFALIGNYSHISTNKNHESHNRPTLDEKKILINGKEVEVSEYINTISNEIELASLFEKLQQAEVYGFRKEIEQKFDQLLNNAKSIVDIDNLLEKYSAYDRISSEQHDAIAHAYNRVGSHDKSLYHSGEAFRGFHSWGLFDKDIKYLRPLINDDTAHALDFVIEISEASIQNLPYAGLGIATLLIKVLGELGDEYHQMIPEIYGTFHEFVGSIFSELPNIFEDDIYDWMRQPTQEWIDFDNLAIQIILSEWGDEVAHRRLYFTQQIPELVLDNPKLWLPTLVEKLGDSNYTVRTQVAIALNAVGLRDLSLLSDYKDQLLAALKSPHIEIFQQLLSILIQFIDTAPEIDDYLNHFYPEVERPEILTPNLAPSRDYSDKVLGRANKQIIEMISDVCRLLDLDEDLLHWNIEKRLVSLGYDKQIAEDEYRERGERYRQGVDGDFIYFETYASYYLYHSFAILIDEIIRKKPFPTDALKVLYNRVCLYDPQLSLSIVEAKPSNILIPDFGIHRHNTEITTEINEWMDFSDLHYDAFTQLYPDAWTTLGHVYSISQEWLYETGQILSCLISRSFAEQIKAGSAVPDLLQAVLVLAPGFSNCTITLPEAHEYLDFSNFSGDIHSKKYIPLIAIHANQWWYYFEHQTILGVVGNWIRKYDLNWENDSSLNMYRNDNRVIKYNLWHDGYFTGAYEYSRAGSGSELLISSTFLNELMLTHNLCLLKTHNVTRHMYRKDHTNKTNGKSYFTVIFPQSTS